jgi:hypothetical protein
MICIVAGVGIGIWWIGPTLVELAYVDERRTEPMIIIELARGPTAAFDAYDGVFDELLIAEEASVLGRYKQVHAIYGPAGKTYDRMTGIRMAAGGDIVQVMTTSAYRQAAAEFKALPASELLKLAGFTAATEPWRDGLVVWLVEEREGVRRPLLDISAAVANSTGRVVWDSEVQPLVSEVDWNRALVVDFASSQAALSWLREPGMVDAVAIANSRAGELALMVMQRR